MIHNLMKGYQINKQEAERMTEYDYMVFIVYSNLEGEKEKYLMDKKSD